MSSPPLNSDSSNGSNTDSRRVGRSEECSTPSSFLHLEDSLLLLVEFNLASSFLVSSENVLSLAVSLSHIPGNNLWCLLDVPPASE